MITRLVAICLDDRIDEKLFDGVPDVEFHHVAADDDDSIDVAILNDLHCPLKLAFVGDQAAKQLATAYGAISVDNADDLRRFWEI